MVQGTAGNAERRKHFSSIDPINFQLIFLFYAAGEGSRSHQFSHPADPEHLTRGQARQHPSGMPLVGLKVGEDPEPFWSARFSFKS